MQAAQLVAEVLPGPRQAAGAAGRGPARSFPSRQAQRPAPAAATQRSVIHAALQQQQQQGLEPRMQLAPEMCEVQDDIGMYEEGLDEGYYDEVEDGPEQYEVRSC